MRMCRGPAEVFAMLQTNSSDSPRSHKRRLTKLLEARQKLGLSPENNDGSVPAAADDGR